MMLKSILISAGLLLAITISTQAQDYNTGIGLRGGFSQGLTVKHFVSDKAALEGILHTRWGGFMVTGLYEIHNDIANAPGLRWYYGGGAHIGFWDGQENNNSRPWGNRNEDVTVLGLDLILGLEYTIPNSPINIGLDYKPEFNVAGYKGVWGEGVALSLRFVW